MAERTLKTLVVTSKVTFAPDNYDPLIVGLAACPQVAGLLVLDNKGWSTVARSIAALAYGAYGLGMTLIKNHFRNSQERREQAYLSRKKPVWSVKRLNSPETCRIIEEYQFDLLLNARTRAFFAPQLLAKPAYGAINIHHGLLPEQRGTMCDLWALSDNAPSGFSIHKMNAEIDAGDILKVVIVSDGTDRDYIKYLIKSSQAELQTVSETLEEIEASGEIRAHANIKSGDQPNRRDPTRADIRNIKRRELRI